MHHLVLTPEEANLSVFNDFWMADLNRAACGRIRRLCRRGRGRSGGDDSAGRGPSCTDDLNRGCRLHFHVPYASFPALPRDFRFARQGGLTSGPHQTYAGTTSLGHHIVVKRFRGSAADAGPRVRRSVTFRARGCHTGCPRRGGRRNGSSSPAAAALPDWLTLTPTMLEQQLRPPQ